MELNGVSIIDIK